MPAAVNLLSRALSLAPVDDALRAQLLPDLAFALLETGDFARMQEVVANLTDVAKASGDHTLEALAVILRLWCQVFTDPEGWSEQAFREATQAIAMFDEHHDERGLARAWSLLGLVNLFVCRFGTSENAWEKAAMHAHAAGQQREEFEYLSWVPLVVWGGPTPVEEAVLRCGELLGRAAADRKATATALYTMAKLEAMRGQFAEARKHISRARNALEEVSLPVVIAGPFTQMAGWVEILAGDPAAAEQELRWGLERLREIGELAWLPTVAGILGEAVYAQGRLDDVEEFLRIVEETAGSEDVYSQALLRGIKAKLLARRGEGGESERFGREAVAIAEPTDFQFIKAFVLLCLGEALQLLGQKKAAREVLTRALDVCQQKGYVVGANQAKELIVSA
jgi:tetratricopeptide (TPR) repeat protein